MLDSEVQRRVKARGARVHVTSALYEHLAHLHQPAGRRHVQSGVAGKRASVNICTAVYQELCNGETAVLQGDVQW
jgi:hypothetical protein